MAIDVMMKNRNASSRAIPVPRLRFQARRHSMAAVPRMTGTVRDENHVGWKTRCMEKMFMGAGNGVFRIW